MLIKGKVSAIYPDTGRISVILPEYDDAVTNPLQVYGGTKEVKDYEINEFVIVVAFNSDLNDAMILGKTGKVASGDGDMDENAIYLMSSDGRYLISSDDLYLIAKESE